ncbi:MAG TPA: IclR family transcriptional regulator [Baekduia sp.]|uniref:IclR family transcriptional regulator n=1 Tax=Baekduia sp. TaxID=2600305 RepID=UPI002D798D26|nr:IclR family transcriptional regulator [Baekduia sp.]HET6506938.1 IclR family transcriptional regulator [Baekduia sp.]
MTESERETAPARAGARRGTIQSVDRAARILKLLASGPRRLGVSEIADRLELARPTVHGLLQTLQAHGFVEQDRDSDKYQLGAGLLHLGNSFLDLNELRGRSIVHAERLAQRARAAVRVGVLHGPVVVVVHHVFRPDDAFQVLEVGAQLPAHATALGKAILAFGPPQAVDDLTAEPLSKLTHKTLAAAALRRELGEARERGIARERDEAVLGEASVAAPIFDHAGLAVGAIALVGETTTLLPRTTPSKALTAAVVDAARGISRELGAPRWPPAG